ncbi:uncharacterized protein LOC125894709 isoform X3 [Epinephelus fuscoguttatus]|uniref:uncharacterized protein LOC125894709 isoform X3 n=1 Tax=Epinephelus fuscoguttatus TaxID=293821 RepID=UPI0020D0FD2B|nr:uncharacterized protein LOC125894709 isoform X3 [Epinephelus fuscoguttatus]XP_049442251.1 uncharacterized protein LOC125894709 isoform X3 [Epinephelus fuscoguttatus]
MFVVCDKNFSSLQRLREPAVSGRQLQEQTTKRRCMEGHSQEAKPDRDDEFTTATKHVGWRTNAGGSSPALISTGSRPGLLRYIPALEGDLPDSGSGPALDQHIPHLATDQASTSTSLLWLQQEPDQLSTNTSRGCPGQQTKLRPLDSMPTHANTTPFSGKKSLISKHSLWHHCRRKKRMRISSLQKASFLIFHACWQSRKELSN